MVADVSLTCDKTIKSHLIVVGLMSFNSWSDENISSNYRIYGFLNLFFMKMIVVVKENYTRYLISHIPAGTQYSGNIRCLVPQRCNVLEIQGTFREHFKGKDFFESCRWKSCFCVKSL